MWEAGGQRFMMLLPEIHESPRVCDWLLLCSSHSKPTALCARTCTGLSSKESAPDVTSPPEGQMSCSLSGLAVCCYFKWYFPKIG